MLDKHIIPNFIQEREVFENIKRSVMDPNFPWFYNSTTGSSYDKSDYLFYHWLYQNGNHVSDHFNPVLMPLLGMFSLGYNRVFAALRAELFYQKMIVTENYSFKKLLELR